MIIDTIYTIVVLETGEVHTFQTSRTESAFYATLNTVYGEGNYQTLEIAKEV